VITVGEDSYVTVAEADKYIETHCVSTDERRTAWEALPEADKEVYLRRAAQAIDSIAYPGVKCEAGQALAFPRCCGCYHARDDQVVPDKVKFAQVEEAFEYGAPGADMSGRLDRTDGVKSLSYDRYSVTYGNTASAGGLDDAIVSGAARELLRPYTGGSYHVR
jgi:hypothetical protein